MFCAVHPRGHNRVLQALIPALRMASGVWLCSLMVLVASVSHADVLLQHLGPSVDNIQALRQQKQELDEQIAQIRQPRDNVTSVFNPGLQQQIAKIEHSQNQLTAQLLALLAQSEKASLEAKNHRQLDQTNRQLTWALWLAAGVTSVSVGLAALAWRQKAALVPSATASAERAELLTTETLPALDSDPESLPEITQINAQAFAEPHAAPDITAAAEFGPEPERSAVTLRPPNTKVWPVQTELPSVQAYRAPAPVGLTDSISTEEALAQARMGFMQPAKIDF